MEVMLSLGPCPELAPLHGLSIARTDAESLFLAPQAEGTNESVTVKLIKSDMSNGRGMRISLALKHIFMHLPFSQADCIVAKNHTKVNKYLNFHCQIL